MLNTKLLAGILLVLAVMFAQVGNVAAAPQTQDTTPTITQIDPPVTDENGVTTVLVTLLLEDQTTQTVRISLAYAVEIGLIDPTTQQPVSLEDVPDGTTIDPNQVPEEIPDEEPAEEDVHPIAALLADFFGEDSSVVNDYHKDGFGFGVIAQAMWMSESINGDASAAGLILEAKQSGDYSAFELPDGSSPTNWGQFKKALRENKDKHNLGVIVSNHAEDEDPAAQLQNGQKKDKEKGKDKKNNHP